MSRKRTRDDDSDGEYHPDSATASSAKKRSTPKQKAKDVVSKKSDSNGSEFRGASKNRDAESHSTKKQSQPYSTQKRPGKPVDPNSKRQLQIKAREATKGREEAEEKATKLQKQLDVIHEQKLASADQGKDYVQDDRTIRSNVDILFKMIADWAGHWAHNGTVKQNMPETDVIRLMDYISGLGSDPSLHILSKFDEAREKFPWCPAGCQRTVEAIISWRVARRIISKPFHFLGEDRGPSEFPKESILLNIREKMPGSGIDKLLWVSRTLRPYYNSSQYGGPVQERIENDLFAKERESAYMTWAMKLVNGSNVSGILLRTCGVEDTQYRINDLVNIFHVAGKLSLQMWVQDSKIELERRPPSGEDLISAITERLCVSRIPPEQETNDTMLSQGLVDIWIRPRLTLIRYEMMGPSIEVKVCPAIYLNIPEAKWRKIRQRHQEMDEKKSVLVKDNTKMLVNEAGDQRKPQVGEINTSLRTLEDIERKPNGKSLQVYADKKRSSKIKNTPARTSGVGSYTSFMSYLPQSTTSDAEHIVQHSDGEQSTGCLSTEPRHNGKTPISTETTETSEPRDSACPKSQSDRPDGSTIRNGISAPGGLPNPCTKPTSPPASSEKDVRPETMGTEYGSRSSARIQPTPDSGTGGRRALWTTETRSVDGICSKSTQHCDLTAVDDNESDGNNAGISTCQKDLPETTTRRHTLGDLTTSSLDDESSIQEQRRYSA